MKCYVRSTIEPALGTRKAPSLTRADLERLHKTIGRASPVTANRVLAVAKGCVRANRIEGIFRNRSKSSTFVVASNIPRLALLELFHRQKIQGITRFVCATYSR